VADLQNSPDIKTFLWWLRLFGPDNVPTGAIAGATALTGLGVLLGVAGTRLAYGKVRPGISAMTGLGFGAVVYGYASVRLTAYVKLLEQQEAAGANPLGLSLQALPSSANTPEGTVPSIGVPKADPIFLARPKTGGPPPIEEQERNKILPMIRKNTGNLRYPTAEEIPHWSPNIYKPRWYTQKDWDRDVQYKWPKPWRDDGTPSAAFIQTMENLGYDGTQ